jgi:hypothetical protein
MALHIPAQTESRHLSTIPRPLPSAIDTASVTAHLTVTVLQHSSARSRASPSSCISSRPFFHGRASYSEEDTEDSHNLPDVNAHRLLHPHAKSAIPISARVSRPFARTPPRIILPGLTAPHLKLGSTSSNTSTSTGSSEDPNTVVYPRCGRRCCLCQGEEETHQVQYIRGAVYGDWEAGEEVPACNRLL